MTDGPDEFASALARDWATIWRSELSAAATDRERAESWSKLLDLWSGFFLDGSLASGDTTGAGRADGAAGRAAPQPSARPAPADAAFDAGQDIGQLLHRIEALERRLAERHATPDGTPPDSTSRA